MGKTPTNAGRVSPKVTAATGASAAGVVLAWLLGQVPFIAGAPAEVQAALLFLLVTVLTAVAGYVRKDAARF